MFYFSVRVIEILHLEHMAILALLERLENFLGKNPADKPPAAKDEITASLLEDLIANLEGEITHHYAFEEEHLFPRFMKLAGPGIPMMLKDEHDSIRPVAKRLAELARGGLDSGFSKESWKEFRDLGDEMVEREVFHVQKEEMGFLPALDQMLTGGALDIDLEETYAAMKNKG